MSGVLKFESVTLRGMAWLDTATLQEGRAERGEPRRARTALGLLRRRIESLVEENRALRTTMDLQLQELAGRLEESRGEGHTQGVEEGRRQVEDELAESFRLLGIQEREVRAEAQRYHLGAERELVALARWLAEQVLARELPLDGERLGRQLQRMLEACLDQQSVRLHLHPGDRRRLLGPEALERLPRLGAVLAELQGRLEWVEAADVPPGACRVELHDGLLDAAPAAMLDHLQQMLGGREAGA